ncbi:hypothetical protein DDZ18_03160 [Marinicauda salina]|uniref:Pili assembly chaperone N-terminal domain-containing protein n=1 Tax=Marinicauda salina TaxID=2135793 RepID=A0A2U2BX92_9PROT|nr:fimbria/pilus periplasmic chaperone [Marinicauda salina]PWE18617.1 hypothetical protein DDZ18_03160 [Marinicauda salina]
MTIAMLARTAVVLALLAAAAPAWAQRVQPMRYDLAPSGPAAQETLRVTNGRDAPLTIEVFAFRLDVSEDGEETLTPAEEDFLIFPPQAIIDAGATQNIRVRYIGEPDLARSEAYRINVRQVPVEFTGEGAAGIGVAVSFMTLVNIVPAGAAPELRAVEVENAGEAGWRVRLRNDGARYARLSEYAWRLGSAGETLTLQGEALARRLGEMRNFIEPGGAVIVDIPRLDELRGPELDVALQRLEG